MRWSARRRKNKKRVGRRNRRTDAAALCSPIFRPIAGREARPALSAVDRGGRSNEQRPPPSPSPCFSLSSITTTTTMQLFYFGIVLVVCSAILLTLVYKVYLCVSHMIHGRKGDNDCCIDVIAPADGSPILISYLCSEMEM